MRSIAIFCALTCALVGAAAAEEGLASFFQYSGYNGLIAAHRSLPRGSQVRVVNLDNGRSVVVTVVDRGPFVRGRVIDVSPEAAVALGFRQAGLAHVRIDPISPDAPDSIAASAPEICKLDADRLERLRSDPTSDEVAQFKRELGCERLRPQLLALASSADNAAPAPVRTQHGIVFRRDNRQSTALATTKPPAGGEVERGSLRRTKLIFQSSIRKPAVDANRGKNVGLQLGFLKRATVLLLALSHDSQHVVRRRPLKPERAGRLG